MVDPTLVDEIGERVERILSDPKSTNEENMARALSVGVKQGGEWNPDLDALLRWHFNYQLVDNACYNLEELPVSAWSEYDECQANYISGIFIFCVGIADCLVLQRYSSQRIPHCVLTTG